MKKYAPPPDWDQKPSVPCSRVSIRPAVHRGKAGWRVITGYHAGCFVQTRIAAEEMKVAFKRGITFAEQRDIFARDEARAAEGETT